jgi:hypothetical protein
MRRKEENKINYKFLKQSFQESKRTGPKADEINEIFSNYGELAVPIELSG